jgi:hypothetical protein
MSSTYTLSGAIYLVFLMAARDGLFDNNVSTDDASDADEGEDTSDDTSKDGTDAEHEDQDDPSNWVTGTHFMKMDMYIYPGVFPINNLHPGNRRLYYENRHYGHYPFFLTRSRFANPQENWKTVQIWVLEASPGDQHNRNNPDYFNSTWRCHPIHRPGHRLPLFDFDDANFVRKVEMSRIAYLKYKMRDPLATKAFVEGVFAGLALPR